MELTIMTDAKNTTPDAKPLDNHATGAAEDTVTTQDNHATGGDITTLDNHATGGDIRTLDNHATTEDPA
jgi:hypothetical protein